MTKRSGKTKYVWDIQDAPRFDIEDNRPDWHTAYPYHQVTSFSSWADVGEYMAPHYAPTPKISKALQEVIANIKT